jgi:hypothetical protein
MIVISKYIQYIMENQIQFSKKEFQKMIFIINAIEKGWSVKKIEDSYIFTKKHEGKKEIFQNDYLEKFVETNLDVTKLL